MRRLMLVFGMVLACDAPQAEPSAGSCEAVIQCLADVGSPPSDHSVPDPRWDCLAEADWQGELAPVPEIYPERSSMCAGLRQDDPVHEAECAPYVANWMSEVLVCAFSD